MDNKKLASYFDGTILKATATPEDIKRLCRDAAALGFATVCINPVNMPLARIVLTGHSVGICTVIGFPLGEVTTDAKVRETKEALALGADEIDMVASVSRLRSGDYNYYLKEIESVKYAAGDKLLKVIIETCYLDDADIFKAAELCIKGGADIVKTSTGFGTRGASVRDIEIIRNAVNSQKSAARPVGIKASGGIRTRQSALDLIKSGATRLGVSGYNQILMIQ